MKKKKKLNFKKRIFPKAVQKKVLSFKFSKVEPLAGFSTKTVRGGEICEVLTKASLVSDDPFFYTIIDITILSGFLLRQATSKNPSL